MSTFAFCSNLGPRYREDLEELLFFNPNQSKVQAAVALIVERYGAPRIQLDNGHLRVMVDPPMEPQTLYVVERSDSEDSLVGVAVYVREGETLSVLYMAVREDHAGRGAQGREPLWLYLIDELLKIARRVKGVSSVTIFPQTPRARRLKVR